jgi:Novel STAND NTPase 1
MADLKNRYPGAQPFSDDDFSRKVFFGRESAARVLADKILANRMVIVYARSGLGKTSLLQAGVASRLRDEGCLPLFARVNDLRSGPFHSVLNTIPGEAARQHVEYVPGLPESLWSFFKTAEFWREDLLLTPVLVLDQFEELFTLQSEQARAEFLDQLSYLTRGVRPPSSTPATEELSEHPPAVRIVLSLREDYLGFLEEAAEHIPQILDARFRLAPLDLQAAREAIVGPAAVSDPGLDTRPFTLDRASVSAILEYLSQRRTRAVGESRRYVEPFQLQLICRRIEQIAAARQQGAGSALTITMADLGGETGLNQTLRDFYRQAIGSLPDRRDRRGARRLCEEYLISPEGRRLSLEENELRRQLDLPKETLGRLVASRLLRSENRSESTYYELSHDALVEPILASRRLKAQVMGMLGIGSGAAVFLLSLALILVITVAFFTEGYEFESEPGAFWAEVVVLFLLGLALLSIVASSALCYVAAPVRSCAIVAPANPP